MQPEKLQLKLFTDRASGISPEAFVIVFHNWIKKKLLPELMIDVDVAGSIGRRYRRQDEVGTPLCVTVDFDTLDDRAVTIRDRDSMSQERVPIDGLLGELKDRLRA